MKHNLKQRVIGVNLVIQFTKIPYYLKYKICQKQDFILKNHVMQHSNILLLCIFKVYKQETLLQRKDIYLQGKLQSKINNFKYKSLKFQNLLSQKLNSQKMKIRNNSSKVFYNQQTNNSKQKSLSELIDNIRSKIYSVYDEKTAIKSFKDIIQRCYNNRNQQLKLCQALDIPFVIGPIALNPFPDYFVQQKYVDSQGVQNNVFGQINYLINYLQKTRQYYYCWIIYFNVELKILSVKLMKKYELKQNLEFLDPIHCMIGIFINRQIIIVQKNRENVDTPSNKSQNPQKNSAFSCYDPISKFQAKCKQLHQNTKNPAEKTNNSQSVYSLKSVKSSKTNSSSFKNQISEKEIQKDSSFQSIQKLKLIKNTQKIVKNFRKKEIQSPIFVQTKNQIVKSISSKFLQLKQQIPDLKSLQKGFKYQITPKSLPKVYNKRMFRSKSIEKSKMSLKQKLASTRIINEKLIQNKQHRNSFFSAQKSLSLIRSKKLSKTKTKIYSRSVTLKKNFVQQKTPSQNDESKNKIQTIFMKIKTSGQNKTFNKKKIEPAKFSSSKNSFDLS